MKSVVVASFLTFALLPGFTPLWGGALGADPQTPTPTVVASPSVKVLTGLTLSASHAAQTPLRAPSFHHLHPSSIEIVEVK